MNSASKRPRGSRQWAVFLLGLFLFLFGLPLIVGGAKLIAVGGSWYYLPAGLAFVASGALLVMRRPLGALIYAGLFVVTLVWTLWETGLRSWALVPRLFGISLLMLRVHR